MSIKTIVKELLAFITRVNVGICCQPLKKKRRHTKKIMDFQSTLDRRPVLNYNRPITCKVFGRFISDVEFSDTFYLTSDKFRIKISESLLKHS